MSEPPSSSERRIVIVGPVHPLAGGVAQHVARLANELAMLRRGEVCVESWKSQYPLLLHRFQVAVDEGSPEVPLMVSCIRKLTWYSPFSWAAAGWRSRKVRAVLFNVVTPFHAVPFALIGLFLGRFPVKVAIVHNALPHERSPFDRILLRTLGGICDAFLVHDIESERLLQRLSGQRKSVVMVRLPDPWQSNTPRLESAPASQRVRKPSSVSALFFGNVRPYKGLNVLLDALLSAPDVHLTVAGNFWGGETVVARQVEERGLAQRVSLRPGYVAKHDIPELFRQTDIVVLPYVSGTASVIPQIAFSYGVPVIATNVGSIAAGVEDQVNGLVVPANNSQELAHALFAFAQSPGLREKLTLGAEQSRLNNGWVDYLRVLDRLTRKRGTPPPDWRRELAS